MTSSRPSLLVYGAKDSPEIFRHAAEQAGHSQPQNGACSSVRIGTNGATRWKPASA